jgi:hypothetical protein
VGRLGDLGIGQRPVLIEGDSERRDLGLHLGGEAVEDGALEGLGGGLLGSLSFASAASRVAFASAVSCSSAAGVSPVLLGLLAAAVACSAACSSKVGLASPPELVVTRLAPPRSWTCPGAAAGFCSSAMCGLSCYWMGGCGGGSGGDLRLGLRLGHIGGGAILAVLAEKLGHQLLHKLLDLSVLILSRSFLGTRNEVGFVDAQGSGSPRHILAGVDPLENQLRANRLHCPAQVLVEADQLSVAAEGGGSANDLHVNGVHRERGDAAVFISERSFFWA